MTKSLTSASSIHTCRAIKSMYKAKYERDPEFAMRTYANGKVGRANVYSPQHVETWIVPELEELIAKTPNAGEPRPKEHKGVKRKKNNDLRLF